MPNQYNLLKVEALVPILAEMDTKVAAAAASAAERFATLTAISASTALTNGKTYFVMAGFNGEAEAFKYVSDSTLTADGALVLTSAMATGRLISTRTVFGTVAAMLADVRVLAVGTSLQAVGFDYTVAASAATDHHLTTAGGVKLYALPGSNGYDVRQFATEANMTASGMGFANAINTAISAANTDGGGIVNVPKLASRYVLGDGVTVGGHIYARSNVWLFFAPAVKITTKATGMTEDYFSNQDQRSAIIIDAIAGSSPSLTEDPAAPTTLDNFKIFGMPKFYCEANSIRVFNLWGIFNDCALEVEGLNTQTFFGAVIDDVALAIGDRVTAFNGLRLKLKYSGTILANSYALVNMFGARVGADGKPACKNLILDNLDLDATGGTGIASDSGHAVACLKTNNVDGITQIGPMKLRGGRAGQLVISNGSANAVLPDIRTGGAPVGVIITTGVNSLALLTDNNFTLGITHESGIGSARSEALVIQGYPHNVRAHIGGGVGGVEFKPNTHRQFAVTYTTPADADKVNRADVITMSGGATAEIRGYSATHLITTRVSEVTGTWAAGETFSVATADGAVTGTLNTEIAVDSPTGVRLTGGFSGGYVNMADATAAVSYSHIAGAKIDLTITGTGASTLTGCKFGTTSANGEWLMNDSEIKLRFTGPPIYCVTNRGNRNRFEIYSDGIATFNSVSAVFTDFGQDNILNVSVGSGNTRHAYYWDVAAASNGLVIERVSGPATIEQEAQSFGRTIIRGNRRVSAEFDMSGAAKTIAMARLSKPVFVTGIEIIYPDGTTADAGVLLNVGLGSDDDAQISITSATSQAAFAVNFIARTTAANAAYLTRYSMAAGEVLTATCAGGKTGADRAVVVVHYAEIFGS